MGCLAYFFRAFWKNIFIYIFLFFFFSSCCLPFLRFARGNFLNCVLSNGFSSFCLSGRFQSRLIHRQIDWCFHVRFRWGAILRLTLQQFPSIFFSPSNLDFFFSIIFFYWNIKMTGFNSQWFWWYCRRVRLQRAIKRLWGRAMLQRCRLLASMAALAPHNRRPWKFRRDVFALADTQWNQQTELPVPVLN